jgi:acetyl-CoA/propionyl-CoA carboxylase biotin carboxyl carrier protein
MTVRIGGRSMQVEVPGLAAAADGPLAAARIRGRQRGDDATQTSAEAIVTPMQGTVVRVAVQDGDLVAAGDLIAVVEAMKMENPLTAPHPGRVTELSATAGDTIAQGTLICRVVADPVDGADPPTDR